MGIFGKIMDKIFHHETAAAPAAKPPQATSSSAPASPPSPSPVASAAAAAPAASQPAQAVDVGAVLAAMASMKGGGNYQTSIVDLLKLLDLDSSLSARKELADELNVHVGADGSAEENIALHRAVIAKLEANGGIVPDSLRT